MTLKSLGQNESTKVFTTCTMGGVLQVEVKGGEVVRIRPLQLLPENIDASNWKIEVNDKYFQPPARVNVAPYALCFRRMVTS